MRERWWLRHLHGAVIKDALSIDLAYISHICQIAGSARWNTAGIYNDIFTSQHACVYCIPELLEQQVKVMMLRLVHNSVLL